MIIPLSQPPQGGLGISPLIITIPYNIPHEKMKILHLNDFVTLV